MKVLKVLKTRTALTMNGLAELRIRYARQSAKAPIKTKEQNRVTKKGYNFIEKTAKIIEKTIDK